MKTILGIIIPTYDSLDTLKVLLRNIEDYTTGDYTTYVIEDGQKQDTIDYLKTKNIKLITHETNKGVAVSWNDGLREAKKDGCTHFAVLNDDIELPAGWWEDCQEAFKDNKIHLIGLNQDCPIPLTGWFFILDVHCLDNVGYFDEQFAPYCGEDDDYFIRYKRSGYKFAKVNINVFHHGSHTINKLRSNNLREVKTVQIENWHRLLRKYPNIKRMAQN